eukprot:403330781
METINYNNQNQSDQHHQQSNDVKLRVADQPKRQSLMNVQRPDFLTSVKQKVMEKLNNARKSQVQNRRQQMRDQLTASKMKNGFIERQVHNEMMQENAVKHYMLEEINQYQNGELDFDIDECIREFEIIQQELNEYLAKQLIESTKFNEEYHYDKYEQHNQREADMLASIYDPSNKDFYICAICKGQVIRVNGTTIQCERPGCININLGNPNFSLEIMMNLVMNEVQDHRAQNQNQSDCMNNISQNRQVTYYDQSTFDQFQQIGQNKVSTSNCEDINLKLRLVNLNEEFADVLCDEDPNYDMEATDQEARDKAEQLLMNHAQGDPKVNLAVKASCDICHYSGIINLYD